MINMRNMAAIEIKQFLFNVILLLTGLLAEPCGGCGGCGGGGGGGCWKFEKLSFPSKFIFRIFRFYVC